MKWNARLGAICAAAVIAVGAGAGAIYVNSFRNYEYVMPGVQCEGVALAGMTRQEAQDAMDRIIRDKRFTVTLEMPDGETVDITPEQTVRETTPGAALETAWSYGREEDSFFGPFLGYRRAKRSQKDVAVDYTLEYSKDSVRQQVAQARQTLRRDPTDCAGAIDPAAHTARITLGQKGRDLDAKAITEQVLAALDRQEDRVAADYLPVKLDQKQLETLLSTLAAEGYAAVEEPAVDYDPESQTAEISLGRPGYALLLPAAEGAVYRASDQGEETLELELNRTLPRAFDLQAYYDWVDSEPSEVYYIQDGALCGGEPGYHFDLEQARAALAAADYGDVVPVKLTVTEPKLSRQMAQDALFRDRLGSSDTYHTGEYNRTTNLRLACQALDGTIINPGEEFSFNGTVGERTAAKGYKTGIVYLGSGSEPQVGGGICQVATGCYQAALEAGMTITERAEHMYAVTYSPGGLDATVYWGYLDVKFKNPWNMPVRLNASVSDGQVHISIDGSNFTGHYIRLSSERVSAPAGHTAYRAYQTIYNPDGSVYDTIDLGVSTYENH